MLKNNSVYFLAICANFPCKIEKFELEVVGVGILFRDKILLPGQPLTCHKFENLFYFSQQHILTEKVKLGIPDACVFKNIFIKEKLD